MSEQYQPPWCVHVIGPDAWFPVADRETAFRFAKEMGDHLAADERLQARQAEPGGYVLCEPTPTIWPWRGSDEATLAQHARCLADTPDDWREWQI